jgi:sRNA-binding protein
MATKKAAKKAEPAKKAAAKMSEEEKAAKKKARLEAIKNRPEGQRTNSKQCDVIETTKGVVKTYAMPVKGFGVVLTTVAEDKDGNVVSTAITTLAGYTVKSKKGHGTLKAGVPGVGKKGKGAKEEEVDEDDEEDEDED